MITFEHQDYKVADLMCGEGIVIAKLGAEWGLPTYANELDPARHSKAKAWIDYDKLTVGDAHQMQIDTRSIAVLLNNPPYQAGLEGEERREYEALKLQAAVATGGIMLYAIYGHHWNVPIITRLSAFCSAVDIYRIPGWHMGQYPQTLAFCRINVQKPMGMSNPRTVELLSLFDGGRDKLETALPDLMDAPDGMYHIDFPVTEHKKRRFFFNQFATDHEVVTRLVQDHGPQLDDRLKQALAVTPIEHVERAPAAPRERQIIVLLAAELLNGAAIETRNGKTLVRATSRQTEERESREDIVDQDGNVVGEKIVDLLSSKLTIKLLFENGYVETLDSEEKRAAFISEHIQQLLSYANQILDPLYKFDLVDGTEENKYKDGALFEMLIALRINGKRALPGQMHVIAAAVLCALEKGKVIVNAAPGFGKSMIWSSAMSIIYQMSKIVWENKIEQQKPTLKALIKRYRKSLMKPGMFSVLMAPPHLTKMDEGEDADSSKWVRELSSVMPEANIAYVKDIITLKNFVTAAKMQPRKLHVMVISREMAKAGEGWEHSVNHYYRRFHNADTGLWEYRMIAHDPDFGEPMIIRRKDEPDEMIRFGKGARYFYWNGEYVKSLGRLSPLYGNRMRGNYNRGRFSEHLIQRGVGTAWQEKRTFSKPKFDVREMLTNDTGRKDRFLFKLDSKGYDERLTDEQFDRVMIGKVEIQKRFSVMPLPDLLEQHDLLQYAKAKKNPRVPLARLLKRYKHLLYAFGADEVHELASTSSDQGKAFTQIANIAQMTFLLTGTLYNGVASGSYQIAAMVNRKLLKRYPWGKSGIRWTRDMGKLQRITITKNADSSYSKQSGTKKNKNVILKELPGYSPNMLATYTPYTITATLFDLGKKLPPLEEMPLPVEMDHDVAANYRHEFHGEGFYSYVKDRIRNRDKSILGTYFQSALSYPDTAYDDMNIYHNVLIDAEGDTEERSSLHVGYIEGLGRDRIYAKEQAVLDLVAEELAQGRGVGLYVMNSGDGKYNLQDRYNDLIKTHLPEASLFSLTKAVDTSKREGILNGKKVNILTTNPILVQTGLDLCQFPTLVFIQQPLMLTTLEQSSYRHWRVIQTEPCKTVFMYYTDPMNMVTTMQHKAAVLMAQKSAASAFMTGKEGASLDAFLDGGGGSVIELLAKNLDNDIDIEGAAKYFNRFSPEAVESMWDFDDTEEIVIAQGRPRFLFPSLPDVVSVQVQDEADIPVVREALKTKKGQQEIARVTGKHVKFVQLSFLE